MSESARLQGRLAESGYIADAPLATALYLAQSLSRPLLLEGDAGTGKTSIALAAAKAAGSELIRLQCYEGLDAQTTLYEWNYQKQLLAIRLQDSEQTLDSIFGESFLLERPLLAAIRSERQSVLLVDEIDRADEEFEAYLLEVLSEYQVSVPELGMLKARSVPLVVLTSNGTRALSDALRRRCLYFYLEHPDAEKEMEIIRLHHPDAGERLVEQAVRFVRELRREELEKKPGIAETLDWVAALVRLDVGALDAAQARERLADTLSCLLKTSADCDMVPPQKAVLLAAKVA